METIISSLVMSSGIYPDRVGGPKEPIVSDLEENLCSSRVECDWWRFRWGEVWASGIPRTSATNQRTNWVRGSSLPCVRPRSDADVGLGWELTRKLSLNSFAKESKEKWMTA
ncbi:hypothetical protein GW17_00049418 [Ensete ventricosum]|nr:hypothetical protein GW17_00049418 [Ensete ventricosum]